MKRLALAALLMSAAACAPTTEAEIQRFEEVQKDADIVRRSADSVTISSYYDEMGDGFGQSKDALAEATRACAISGKRPEYLSVHKAATPTPNIWSGLTYKNEFEFACV